MIEASRRFCKVDVVVKCDDQIVCKVMITAQAFGEAWVHSNSIRYTNNPLVRTSVEDASKRVINRWTAVRRFYSFCWNGCDFAVLHKCWSIREVRTMHRSQRASMNRWTWTVGWQRAGSTWCQDLYSCVPRISRVAWNPWSDATSSYWIRRNRVKQQAGSRERWRLCLSYVL